MRTSWVIFLFVLFGLLSIGVGGYIFYSNMSERLLDLQDAGVMMFAAGLCLIIMASYLIFMLTTERGFQKRK